MHSHAAKCRLSTVLGILLIIHGRMHADIFLIPRGLLEEASTFICKNTSGVTQAAQPLLLGLSGVASLSRWPDAEATLAVYLPGLAFV